MAGVPKRRGGWPWSDLPSGTGDVLRPGLPPVVEEIMALISAEVPEYAQPMEGGFGTMVREGVTVALDTFVELIGSDDDVGDLALYHALGKAEMRAGRTLDALQSAYRLGAQVAWRAVADGGQKAGLEPAVLYRLAESIFAYIDRLAAASVAGYAQEQSDLAGAAQARRHALIELMTAAPPAELGEVQRVAALAGWPLPTTLAVLAVGDADAAAFARRLPAGSIGASLDPVGLVLLPDPDAPGRPGRVVAALETHAAVVGPTVPWAQAHRSASRARAAWQLHRAGALGSSTVVRADEALLPLLLVADPTLTSDLVRRRLAPLDAMTPVARERAETTLRAWFDAHGDVTQTAELLHVHSQTVRYRLAGLREAFAGALDDPTARLETALALRATALPADPSDPAGSLGPSCETDPGIMQR